MRGLKLGTWACLSAIVIVASLLVPAVNEARNAAKTNG